MLEQLDQQAAAKVAEAKRWLLVKGAYLALHVANCGNIYFSDEVETAGIVSDDTSVYVLFNKEWLQSLKIGEVAAILMHEAGHFVFRHHARYVPNLHDRQVWYYACEVAINDAITHYTKFPLPGKPITGQLVLGIDAWDLSAEQIYSRIPKQQINLVLDLNNKEANIVGEPIDDHNIWGTTINLVVKGSTEEELGIKKESQGHTTNTDNIIEHVLAQVDVQGNTWGTQAAQGLRQLKERRVRASLIQYLTEATRAALQYETLWTQPNRKAIAIYPQILLPVYEPKNKHRILIAIDVSGSMSNASIDIANAIAKQRMENVEVEIVYWDTAISKEKDGCVSGGGGTDPKVIVEYMKTLKDKPDSVFVFTDGYFENIRLDNPREWIWVITGWGTISHIPKPCKKIKYTATSMKVISGNGK